MKPKLQEILALIHQAYYSYHPKRLVDHLLERLAYGLSIVLLIAGSVIAGVSFNVYKEIFNPSGNSDLVMGMIVLGATIFISLMFWIYGRQQKKYRLYRSKIKTAESKLEEVISSFDTVMNELN